MTEFEKMRREEFYDFTSEECLASYYRAKHLCAKLQTMTTEDEDYRKTIEELIPGIPESSTVTPPFHCDHGHGIKLGENVFINYNGTMLDGGIISIGSNTQVGPNCQFLTPNHPIDYIERRKPIERCSPINIGEDCWLGGGVTVCPGVTIGDRCIIGVLRRCRCGCSNRATGHLEAETYRGADCCPTWNRTFQSSCGEYRCG